MCAFLMAVELSRTVKPMVGKNNLNPKMYVNIESTIGASKVRGAKRNTETITGVLTKLIEEKITTNFEPHITQISMLNQILNQVIQNNSAKTTPTVGRRTHRRQAEPLFSRKRRTGRIVPGTAKGKRERERERERVDAPSKTYWKH